MKYSVLYGLWGVLFLLCAGLGMIPEPEGLAYGLCLAVGLAFFIPGGMIVHRAVRENNREHLRTVRNLCLLSLGLTVLTLLVNILSALGSEQVGQLLYVLLVVVSSPMICCQIWVLSLFGWAVLLMCCLQQLKKKK